MSQSWVINYRRVVAILIAWLGATNVLAVLTHATNGWLAKALLFICVVFLPGAAFLRSIRIIFPSFTMGVLYSFGVSVFILMLSGLITNQLQPMLGINRPLESFNVLIVWNLLVLGLILVGKARNKQPLKLKRWSIRQITWPAWTVGFLSLLMPALAALGAFKLNNGGDASLALLALYIIGASVIYAVWNRRQLSDGALTWLVFSIGLAILLMTSLRGWDIVGHDIQREFRVYTLTHLQAYWDIALDRDPYNACVSITILPEVLGQILHTSGLVVFKFLLQIIFAACCAVVFMLTRQYVSQLAALGGTMLFICYPTFINDSAMLTRQGVAYLFFALAIMAMLRRPLGWQHKILFLLCALGAILSHYSTAYMFVALFAVAVACKYVLRLRARLVSRQRRYEVPTIISPWYAGLIFLMTFVWYTQITETSTGLFVTVQKSLANITKIFSDDNKSADTSTALFFANNKTSANLYESYLDKARSHRPANTGSEYLPSLVSDTMPLTALGEKARSVGIDPSIITMLRQNFARALQILALAGVGYTGYWLVKRRRTVLPADAVFLSASAIILLALLTLLPVVSVNYGILRAFQQSLIFLIVPMTLFLVAVSRWIKPALRTFLAALGITGIFFLFTGAIAQLLGGTSPSLTLNNYGLYYRLYYSTEADQRSFAWMRDYIPKKGDVRAANFNRVFMHEPLYPFQRTGILPSQITPASFVYADEAQVRAQRFYTYYESSPLIMTFPLEYYEATKNTIYSTGATRVYR